MSTMPVTPSAEPKSIGAVGRIVGAIISPGETFADIARRPTWLFPVIVLTLVALTITILFTQRVGWERFLRRQIQQNERAAAQMEQIPAERRAEVMRQQAEISKYFGYFFGTAGQLLFVVIVAVVMLGVFNLLGGAGLRFQTALAVTAHAAVPGIVAGLFGIAFILFDDPASIDLTNLVPLNLGALWAKPAWLHALGLSLDVFSFWTMFLLAVGFRAAATRKKFTTGGAFVLVMVPWAFYVLLKTAFAAVFS